MTDDLLAMPKFLRRSPASDKKHRKLSKNAKKTWARGVPVQRPTRAQYATLAKRDWGTTQIASLSRSEAAEIIKLGVGPEARFTKNKKHQFPEKKDNE